MVVLFEPIQIFVVESSVKTLGPVLLLRVRRRAELSPAWIVPVAECVAAECVLDVDFALLLAAKEASPTTVRAAVNAIIERLFISSCLQRPDLSARLFKFLVD